MEFSRPCFAKVRTRKGQTDRQTDATEHIAMPLQSEPNNKLPWGTALYNRTQITREGGNYSDVLPLKAAR